LKNNYKVGDFTYDELLNYWFGKKEQTTIMNPLDSYETTLNDMLHDVRNFMEGFDQPIRTTPAFRVPADELFLRIHLIKEEFQELQDAVNVESTSTGLATTRPHIELIEALDALTDLLYVVLGTYHTLGLASYAQDAWRVVHTSNMSKFGLDGKVIKSPAGKVLKGPNYLPPNLTKLFVE